LAYIQGEVRGQQALFPSTLDELIPPDHVCRVIEAWRDMIRDERRHADAEVHVESVTQFASDTFHYAFAFVEVFG
jgi:hypothetical protein